MQAHLIIRLTADAEWLSIDEQGETGPVHNGLPGLADVRGKQLVALVPGERVLSTQVNVPTRNRARMLKALPFAVEDQLVCEVESQHVAAGAQTEDMSVAVNVVAREDMTAWCATLAEAGLKPDVMLADYMALPDNHEQAVIVLEDERALARTGATGFVCALENLRDYWAALEPTPAEVRLYDARTTPRDDISLNGTVIDYRGWNDQPLALFAGAPERGAINLLQGAFAPQQQSRTNQRLWRIAAAVAAVWLVLLSIFAISDYFMLRARAGELEHQIATRFNALLPNQPLVNARVQIEQALEARGGGSTDFVALLARLAPVIEDHSSVSLQALQYRGQTLTMRVTAPSIAALDSLRRALAANSAFQVELESATASGGGVDGRLSISRSSG